MKPRLASLRSVVILGLLAPVACGDDEVLPDAPGSQPIDGAIIDAAVIDAAPTADAQTACSAASGTANVTTGAGAAAA